MVDVKRVPFGQAIRPTETYVTKLTTSGANVVVPVPAGANAVTISAPVVVHVNFFGSAAALTDQASGVGAHMAGGVLGAISYGFNPDVRSLGMITSAANSGQPVNFEFYKWS